MRISDGSSDVCSSDLENPGRFKPSADFHDRVAADAGPLGDQILTRDLERLALIAEQHAMIHAAKIIALDAAERKRREAVNTPVLESNGLAVGLAIDDDRLTPHRQRTNFLEIGREACWERG